jgi:NADH:ubiquinone oxidoreductase subunit 6 (subunit J)
MLYASVRGVCIVVVTVVTVLTLLLFMACFLHKHNRAMHQEKSSLWYTLMCKCLYDGRD